MNSVEPIRAEQKPDGIVPFAKQVPFHLVGAANNSIIELAKTDQNDRNLNWLFDLQNQIIRALLADTSVEQLIEIVVATLRIYFPSLRVSYGTICRNGILRILTSWQPSTMRSMTGLVADLNQEIPEVLRILKSGQPFMSANVTSDRRLSIIRENLKLSGAQAILNVPLMLPDQSLGIISFDSPKPCVWQQHEIDVFQEIAQLVSLVLHKSQHQAERQQLETATKFQQSLLTWLHETSLDGNIVCRSNQQLQAWNQRFLDIWKLTADQLQRCNANQIWQLIEAQLQDPLQLTELATINEVQTKLPSELLTLDQRIISCYTSALRDQEGKLLGQVWYFRDITSQVQREQEQRKQALRSRLLETVWQTREDEQRRIARDLHDSVGQALTGLNLGLRAARAENTLAHKDALLSEMQDLLRMALVDVSRLTQNLRPTVLDDLGLVAAIDRLTRTLQSQHQLKFDLRIQLRSQDRLPGVIETALFRLIQEALNNAVKHAAATQISIKLTQTEQQLYLCVQDNGRGFSTTTHTTSEFAPGMGLTGMQERVQLLEGRFDLQSTLGQGTRIDIFIPYNLTNS